MSQTRKIYTTFAVVLLLLALLKVFLIGAGNITQLEPAPDSTFPTLTGVSLEGKDITLPKDFIEPLNLVILAFDDDHQTAIDSWSKGFHNSELVDQDISFYALPVLYEMEYIQRFFYNNWLKVKSGDAAYNKKTITVYFDRSKFFKLMDIEEDNVYAFLTNNDGKILWIKKGAFKKEYLSEIQTFMTK